MAKAFATALLVVVLCVVSVAADLYMHNPRGSNDRNCERNQDRNNGNRLFDSQNNDKGGYPCPRAVGGPEVVTNRLYYYAGSQLRMEWTNQHACGTNEDTDCQIIIQYMCEDANPLMMDGTPTDADDAATDRMDETDLVLANSTDPADVEEFQRYGYHETYAYYSECYTRQRNQGLWIADRNLNNGVGATATRQNNNGDRHGWECAEERDYYPYWHPAPWKDLAILTSNPNMCSYYKKESYNVQSKGRCVTASGMYTAYNNPTSCAQYGMIWSEQPPHNIDAPDCQAMYWTRDNHLGNLADGEMARYWLTIPNVQCKSAVLRMRYNVSNAEVDWDYDYTDNSDENGNGGALTGDPYVEPFDSKFTGSTVGRYNLSFAVNTDQYGRTFQDRSYLFSIVKGIPGTNIINLNVRGKRGNIVQTFPALEYDFVPQYLNVYEGDVLHIQWAGTDYNIDTQPNNGEGGPTDPANPGTYRADRTNMVQKADDRANYPIADNKMTLFKNSDQALKFSYINQDLTKCLTYEQLLTKNGGSASNANFDSQNCGKLNAAATPYFDGGLVQVPSQGTYFYYSTRNNNFSNRGQKAHIVVSPKPLTSKEKAAIGVGAGVAGAGCIFGGSYMYARRNPASKAAQVMSRFM